MPRPHPHEEVGSGHETNMLIITRRSIFRGSTGSKGQLIRITCASSRRDDVCVRANDATALR